VRCVPNPPTNGPETPGDLYAAWCRCGTPLAEGEHRVCAGEAAHHHSVRVEVRADLLLSRLRAIHLMGTMNGELRPLSSMR
jgi:hypothetical protein